MQKLQQRQHHGEAVGQAFAGDLASLGAGPVLQMLGRARASGLLRFYRSGQTAELALEDGKVLWARGSVGYRLGELLMAANELEPKALAEALRQQRASARHQSLGLVLAALGHASPVAIVTAIGRQSLSVVREVLEWTEGSYALDASASPRGGLPAPERCRIDALLLEASRHDR